MLALSSPPAYCPLWEPTGGSESGNAAGPTLAHLTHVAGEKSLMRAAVKAAWPRSVARMVGEEDDGVNELRRMWWVAVLLIAGAFLLKLESIGVPVAIGQSATPGAVTAPVPDWRFVVHEMQDPYGGVLTNPAAPAPGVRYVGFDVEVVNASDQPLTVPGNAVVLWDDEGFTYRSGAVAGSEPPLPAWTLHGGERVRGWVWFGVPEGTTLSEILLVASAPELRLRLGLDGVPSLPGTPSPTATPTPGITPSPTATATPPATPLPTEPPAATTVTATAAPTSAIITEPAETPEEAVPATATPAVTATAGATATVAAAATGIAPGSTVITGIADTNVRDSPSLSGAIVATIPLGTELTITGPSVDGDDLIWWPVTVVATGAEGYVAEDLLTLLEE